MFKLNGTENAISRTIFKKTRERERERERVRRIHRELYRHFHAFTVIPWLRYFWGTLRMQTAINGRSVSWEINQIVHVIQPKLLILLICLWNELHINLAPPPFTKLYSTLLPIRVFQLFSLHYRSMNHIMSLWPSSAPTNNAQLPLLQYITKPVTVFKLFFLLLLYPFNKYVLLTLLTESFKVLHVVVCSCSRVVLMILNTEIFIFVVFCTSLLKSCIGIVSFVFKSNSARSSE